MSYKLLIKKKVPPPKKNKKKNKQTKQINKTQWYGELDSLGRFSRQTEQFLRGSQQTKGTDSAGQASLFQIVTLLIKM